MSEAGSPLLTLRLSLVCPRVLKMHTAESLSGRLLSWVTGVHEGHRSLHSWSHHSHSPCQQHRSDAVPSPASPAPEKRFACTAGLPALLPKSTPISGFRVKSFQKQCSVSGVWSQPLSGKRCFSFSSEISCCRYNYPGKGIKSSYWEDVKSIRKEAMLKIKFHLSNITNGNPLVCKILFISFLHIRIEVVTHKYYAHRIL